MGTTQTVSPSPFAPSTASLTEAEASSCASTKSTRMVRSTTRGKSMPRPLASPLLTCSQPMLACLSTWEKTEEFLRFAQEKAGAWIGLPGQIKELDELAKELAGAADKAVVIKKAEAVAADSKEDTAKYYIKVMQKAGADAEFVTKESTRLKRMMEDGSVKASKKEQFGRRLNVLSSF